MSWKRRGGRGCGEHVHPDYPECLLTYPGTANIKSLARAVLHPADVLGSGRPLAAQGRKVACWAWAREWVRRPRWFCVHAHACPGLTHTCACFMALVVFVGAKMLVV